MLDEFKKFLFRGNIIDLAVAVVIGAAFTAVINSFVTNIITPLLGLFGDKNFDQYTVTLKDGVVVGWGALLTAIINFVLVAAAVFFLIVKPVNVINERRKRGEMTPEEEPVPTDEALLLAEIRDLLQSRAS